MSYLRGLAVHSFVFLGLLACGFSSSAVAEPAENNIKLVIDVSGSMKKNDPENLRRPAVNLLMNLLPEDASAGVWLFGDQVEVLVPFGEASPEFKRLATERSGDIHSRGLLTDVGAALEQAMLAPPMGSKAILLSDGMVDIGPDQDRNKMEVMRIKEQLVPLIRNNGAEVHTVALSDQADQAVLSEIALGTGGLFETAQSSEQLTRIFLRLFDDVVLQDRLPLENGQFLVDSSVEEFTLLAFHGEDATPIQLRSPSNEFYLADDHPSFVSWYQDAGYDLITIARPEEGEWKLFADDDPQNRVTAVSDLKLEVTDLANMIHEGAIPSLEVMFYQAKGKIVDPQFLEIMDVQLVVLTPAGKRIAKPLADHQEGIFVSDLGVFAEPGRYRITVSVDGRTFKREVVQEVEYGSPAKLVFSPSTSTLTVRPLAAGLLNDDMRMIARIESATAKKKLVPLKHDGEIWFTELVDLEPGDYKATVHVKGVANTGQPLDFDLPSLELTVAAAPEPVVEEVEESIWTLDNYLLIAAIAGANIIIIGLIVWFVRRKSVPDEDEEVAELISSVDMNESDKPKEPLKEADVEAALDQAKAMQEGKEPEPVAPPPEESEPAPETEEPEVAAEADTELDTEVDTDADLDDAPDADTETETETVSIDDSEGESTDPAAEESEALESGEGLSDIVDAWNDAPDDDSPETDPESESAPEADADEVDENAQTVKFDPPATETDAEMEADMEAAIGEEDENDQADQSSPASDDGLADGEERPSDDDEPVDKASSG